MKEPKDWEGKVSSYMLYEKLKSLGKEVFYAGKVSEIKEKVSDKIDEKEVTCFIGAGDMDLYYPEILNDFGVESYF